jgi:hypothetical protein
MNKYRSIELLLQHLADAIATGQVAVAPRWRDDEQAVGFYKPGEPQLSAYVSTHGQPPGYYGVDLTYPELDDNDVGNVPTSCEDVRLIRVLDLLIMHFGIYEIERGERRQAPQ